MKLCNSVRSFPTRIIFSNILSFVSGNNDIHFSRRNTLVLFDNRITFTLVILMEVKKKKKIQENVMVTRVS